MDTVRSVSRSVFNKKQLFKKVPILDWLPKYDVQTGVSDLIAGTTVGLTVIPQGIAYALIAKLPPQYGLYSAFMGCFMYVIFGSCKDITVGPTAIMSLLTAQYAMGRPEFAVLLSFLTGLIVLLLGLLRLGFVIDFISVPVTAGFTSAAAITIASGQVKSLFGLKIEKHGDNDTHHEGIAYTWIEIVENFESVRYQDTILGLSCVVILLCMRALKNANWLGTSDEEPGTGLQNLFRKCFGTGKLGRIMAPLIWVISTARNAIIVVICTFLAYGCDPHNGEGKTNRNGTFVLTGKINGSLPAFEAPPFSFNDTEREPPKFYAFGDMVSEMGIGVIILPLLAILENVAIAKAFSGGKPVDADQEMIALGICNFMGSFTSGMPITGSFSRTAVNSASGVKTPMGCLWTGALVILALGLIMPYCAFIPKASLAAVIITAVIFSVEYEVIRPMWRSKKIDLIPAFATFFCCLFWALEWGILVGVGIQILLILYHIARPSVNVDLRRLNGFSEGGHFLFVTLDRALIFPSVSYVRHKINKAGVREGESRLPLVLDCSHISNADFTAAEGFKAMITDFRRRNQPIIFYNTSPSVIDTFLGVNIEEFVVVHSLDELNEHLIGLMGHNEEAAERMSASMMKSNGDHVEGINEN